MRSKSALASSVNRGLLDEMADLGGAVSEQISAHGTTSLIGPVT
jgi:hypothetical protein